MCDEILCKHTCKDRVGTGAHNVFVKWEVEREDGTEIGHGDLEVSLKVHVTLKVNVRLIILHRDQCPLKNISVEKTSSCLS